MKPFLNWAGGKRWLVSRHADLIATPGHRLVEPFVGSGAVYFHLEPSQALLSDANKDLIEAYVAVRDEPDAVLDSLRTHQRHHDSDYYYRMRASRPRKTATRAARLIYLNRTCFNGLYRVNLKGVFNVPKGSKESVILPDDDFNGWSRMLKTAELVAQDFQATVDTASAGDVVYADPPYTVQHNMNNFVKYNEHIFSWQDQVRLASCLHAATQRGVRIIISNADHPSIRKLYEASGWRQIAVERHSRLAASADHRRPTTELIISNCISLEGEQTEPRTCE